jgi:hypothetical protein
MTMHRPKVDIKLTAYNMGDESTESMFDTWAIWVAENVDDACGVRASVDQFAFRGGPADDYVASNSDEAAENVREWLSGEGWQAWCAMGAP